MMYMYSDVIIKYVLINYVTVELNHGKTCLKYVLDN